jgi:hypothetical protein
LEDTALFPGDLMFTKWTISAALALAAIVSCTTEGLTDDPDPGGGSKADDGSIDPAECELNSGVEREIDQFVNADHVQFACRNLGNGQFVKKGCCASEIREFQFATGCPLQAKFKEGDDGIQRCVEDFPDSIEMVEGELTVPTVCCEKLCEDARWDDAEAKTACSNSAGERPPVCCEMNDDDLRCGAAAFDEEPDSTGFRHCRAKAGEFAGQFAPAACCADRCFELVEQADEVPIECLLAIEDECIDAEVDDNNLCRRPDGRFAKGLCCQDLERVDIPSSDDCYAAELTGRDLSEAGCEA